jgi:copper(I)-binding protein
MRPVPLFLTLCMLAWLSPARAATPTLAVTDAWVRAVPGSDVAAAYFTVRNDGPQPLRIESVTSPAATSAMLHDSSVVGGQSTMRPHGQIVLGPGQSLVLRPGGTHLMLMGLVRPLQPGDRVPLVLRLADGEQVSCVATVRPLTAP